MKELVFDIGLNNGDDSAYYLHLGYRVVGVEANPTLAQHCARRFAAEIESGRMRVVNAGILRQPGEFTLYCSLREDGWSTFTPEINNKPGEWKKVAVPCMTTAQLIQEHGAPFFIKVDIEGADFQALESLTPAAAPPYISLELNGTDPFVERLSGLGYTAFKFVDGETFYPNPRIFDHQIGWRILRKASAAIPGVKSAMRALPPALRPKSEWNPPGHYSPDGYAFTNHCSGPFGEDAAGRWMDAPAALKWFAALKEDYRKAGRSDNIWWDIHGRHSSVKR